MYTGAKELRLYVKSADNPTLNEFIEKHFDIIESEDCTLRQLMVKWRDRFTSMLKRHRPNINVGTHIVCDINIWKRLKTYSTNDLRSVLFQWMYILEEKKSEDLPAFLEEKKETIEALESYDGDEVPTLLDKLSLSLLKKYNDLSCIEQNILKLSLSRIIDLVDEDFAEYFKQHIPVHHFGMWSNLKKENELTEEEQAKLKEIAQDFAQRAQSDLKAARKYILLKRVDYEEEQECSLEAMAYKIIDNINTLMKDNNNNHVQKADHVAFVKQLFQIVFRGTNLKIAIGETVAAATKPSITYNESSFSNSKDSVFISKSTSSLLAHTSSSSSRRKDYTGRKIDLKIIGDDDQELSFWEFKTRNASQKSLQHQESKTLRLTQCLQKSVKSAFDLKKDIMSITWSGNT
ncbi:uncharacterized protein B0P05DRAFT_535644 [Gilbertella persicaria]|uniref:uncharacterized protein n=1 Tax=Gilbertella persicaria TaxID=101096 RepID=UPI00221ED924|nr:uncharacterized protein B0P05DRAFT_535644 [Gilbertella persicaria]KAI8083966.1 hypothetical protein B0P05DRAFT_535644 [Gilbertella persicaria]